MLENNLILIFSYLIICVNREVPVIYFSYQMLYSDSWLMFTAVGFCLSNISITLSILIGLSIKRSICFFEFM